MGIRTVLLILLATPWGQLSGQAIQGQLLYAQSGQPILLAQVTLLVGSGQIVDQTYTDETGYFIVASEDPESFFLRAERLGSTGLRCIGEGTSPRGWVKWCLHRTSPLSRSFGAPRRPPFNSVGPRVHVGSF